MKITALVLAAAMTLVLASCGKSEFAVTELTEKKMVIDAQRAGKDDFFLSGGLEVEEGEMISATADLSEGTVKVELFLETEDQSIDEMPDVSEMTEEAVMTGNMQRQDAMSGTVTPGTYMVQATVLEKATGTVVIEVVPAEEAK